MMTALKYTAIASAFLLTAGSAAFAQNYSGNYNEGSGGYTHGYNPGPNNQGYSEGGQGFNNPGMQGFSNQGMNEGWQGGQQGWNQGMNEGWRGGQQGSNQGMQGPGMQGQGMQGPGNEGWTGSSGQYGQFNSGAGFNNMGLTEHQAVQELRGYGYNQLQDLRPMRGWSVQAEKNGQRVHIIMGDNGEVATFQGR